MQTSLLCLAMADKEARKTGPEPGSLLCTTLWGPTAAPASVMPVVEFDRFDQEVGRREGCIDTRV